MVSQYTVGDEACLATVYRNGTMNDVTVWRVLPPLSELPTRDFPAEDPKEALDFARELVYRVLTIEEMKAAWKSHVDSAIEFCKQRGLST